MDTQRLKGVGYLFVTVGIVWGIMGYALPLLTNSFTSTRELPDFIDESGIETGQFFYTGVETVNSAESGARGAIFFTDARKMFLDKEK